MASARKKKRKSPANRRMLSLAAVSATLRRPVFRVVFYSAIMVCVAGGVASGLSRLDDHGDQLLRQESQTPSFTFVDLPRSILSLAQSDLESSLDNVKEIDWTSDSFCRRIYDAVSATGWVEKVDFVRRLPGARIEIQASYRIPLALVQREDAFFLVDRQGMRLPGRYVYDTRWPIIQGVVTSPPRPGETWVGGDLQAGLAVIESIREEPFFGQVTGVLVDNFDGRRDPRKTHIELATDRAGGRIRWGSAPGMEIEENSVAQKLMILRQNYKKTGRLDAGYPIIDISTFHDRFTVSG